jgi:hypothetical protein
MARKVRPKIVKQTADPPRSRKESQKGRDLPLRDPRQSKGKTIRGTITVVVQGTRLKKSFSAHIR